MRSFHRPTVRRIVARARLHMADGTIYQPGEPIRAEHVQAAMLTGPLGVLIEGDEAGDKLASTPMTKVV